MTTSTTLAHAAIKDLYSALGKVKAMMGDTQDIRWEIIKPIESLEEMIKVARRPSQEELGFD